MEDFETKLNENEGLLDASAVEDNAPCEPTCDTVERVGFAVTPALVYEHYKILGKSSWLISVVVGILLFATFAFDNLTQGGIVGIVGMLIMKLIMHLIYSRNAKQAVAKLEESTSIYELKQGYIEYSGFEHGELVHFRRIKLDSIISVTKTAKVLNFVSEGISYIIDNEALTSDSKIEEALAESKPITYALGAKKPKERKGGKEGKKSDGSVLNVVMLLLTIASVIASILIFAIDFNTKTAWIPVVLMLIPVAYFVFFAIAEFKNRKTSVALTIIATLCAGIIWIFGVIFTSFDTYGFTEDEAIEMKNEFCEVVDLNVELDPVEAYYYENTIYSADVGEFVEVYNADIHMDSSDKEDVSAFRKALTSGGNWSTPDSSLYMNFYEKYTQHTYCDIVLIYNATSGEYNAVPDESGTYYVACYSASGHFLSIYKFTLD